MTRETDSRDLMIVLDGLKGTVLNKCKKMGEIMYKHGAELFRIINRKKVDRF